MKALSVKQPWAGLIVLGLKPIENRGRHLIAPGKIFDERILIHASKTIDPDGYATIREIAPELDLDKLLACQVLGAAIGAVTVDDVIEEHWSLRRQTFPSILDTPRHERWYDGHVGYVLRDHAVLATPVPCKGMLGFWTVPDDIAALVTEQIAAAEAELGGA